MGRFTGVDPLASDYAAWSPYNYTFNNPVRYIDPDGRLPIIPIIAGIWALAEIGMSAYDVYDATTTVMDPNASTTQKITSVGGAAAGIFLPGGGYSAVDDVVVGGIRLVDNYADDVVEQVVKHGGDAKKAAGIDIARESGDFARRGSTGKVGEDFLSAKYGGKSQVHFKTSSGGRRLDQVANGVGYESKVGYTSLTKKIQGQIAKDA